MKKTTLFGFGMMVLLGLALIVIGMPYLQAAPVAPAVVAGDTIAAVDLNSRDAVFSSDEIAAAIDTSDQSFWSELAATRRDDMTGDDAALAMVAPVPPAAPAPSAAAAPADWHHPKPRFVWHRVRWGETLSGIADRFDTSVWRLVRLNGIRCADHIVAGRWILVPA